MFCYLAVYWLTFSLVLFYLSMLIMAKVNPQAYTKYWLIKSVYLGGILAVTWFHVPTEFYNDYVYYSRWLSGVFVLYQDVVLLVMLYELNEALVNREMYKTLGIMSGLLYIAIGVILVWMIKTLAFGRCSFNRLSMTLTVVLILLYSIFSITEAVPRSYTYYKIMSDSKTTFISNLLFSLSHYHS